MGGKVCLIRKGKTLLGVVNKLLNFQKFVDNAQQCFAFTPQANFPAHNLKFSLKVMGLNPLSRQPFEIFSIKKT